MSKVEVKLDTKNLDYLEKLLKKAKVSISVGILGQKNSRPEDAGSNALIGAVHEFGSAEKNIPERSFLRMPLNNHFFQNLKSAGLSKLTFNKVIKEKSMMAFAQKIAIVAEATVIKAFDTGGYGEWPAWKNTNYKNNSNMLLVDTQQLRNSISTEVRND